MMLVMVATQTKPTYCVLILHFHIHHEQLHL